MGQTASCCNPRVQNTDLFKLLPFDNDDNTILHQNDYQYLRSQLRQIGLLGALDYQMTHIQIHGLPIAQINAQFSLISRFVELIQHESKHTFLNILQSKTINLTQYDPLAQISHGNKTQVCLLDVRSVKANNMDTLMEDEIKYCFKILRLLKLELPLSDYGQEDVIAKVLHQLRSIPQMQQYLWDMRKCKDYHQMSRYLKYYWSYFISFLNSYLSLNHPTSYLHIRHLFHLSFTFLCNPPVQQLYNKYICSFTADPTQALLYRHGLILVATNFITFLEENQNYREAFGKSRTQSQNSKQMDQSRLGEDQIVINLIIELPENYKWKFSFINKGKMYFLPFSMFNIAKISRKSKKWNIYLEQLPDQIIIRQLCRPHRGQSVFESNHVIINQFNLTNQMQALRGSLGERLEETIQNIKNQEETDQHGNKISSKAGKLVVGYYQRYRHRLASLKHGQDQKLKKIEQTYVEKEQIVKSLTNQEEDILSDLDQNDMIELTAPEAAAREKKLQRYIKEYKLEKLFNQIYDSDVFFKMKVLNLSQSALPKIQCLECFPNLTELYLYSNEITVIEGLSQNIHLRILSLANNIDHLLHLRQLFVTKNPLKRDSAQYICGLKLKRLLALSVSFRDDPNDCFEVLSQRTRYRIYEMFINQAGKLSQKTKNMLRKRLKRTTVHFFDS